MYERNYNYMHVTWGLPHLLKLPAKNKWKIVRGEGRRRGGACDCLHCWPHRQGALQQAERSWRVDRYGAKLTVYFSHGKSIWSFYNIVKMLTRGKYISHFCTVFVKLHIFQYLDGLPNTSKYYSNLHIHMLKREQICTKLFIWEIHVDFQIRWWH